MNFNNICTLISLGITFLAIVVSATVTIFQVVYQTHNKHDLEKEKERLEIYSEFLAYCTKKNANCISFDETNNFIKIYTKTMLTTDYELNKITEELYFSVLEHPQSDKTIQLLNLATCEMHKRLKIFNRLNHRVHKHY